VIWISRKKTLKAVDNSLFHAYEQATDWHKQHPEL